MINKIKMSKEKIIKELKDSLLKELQKTFEGNLKTVKTALKNSFIDDDVDAEIDEEELNKLSEEVSIFSLREHIKLITNYKW